MRRRSAILEALELFRDLSPAMSMGQLISFLYACENEGLTLLDLSQVSGLYLATASRSIRIFAEPDAEGACPPGLGLIELVASDRGKTIRLTAAGRAFRDRLEAVIADASPIRPAPVARIVPARIAS